MCLVTMTTRPLADWNSCRVPSGDISKCCYENLNDTKQPQIKIVFSKGAFDAIHIDYGIAAVCIWQSKH